jgi:drug/metabolite transporter (DMT)-like permease
MFRIIFKEKASWHALLGIVLMLTGIMCVSIQPNAKPGDPSLTPEEQRADCYKALAIGLLAPILMSSKHVIVRANKRNYDAIT